MWWCGRGLSYKGPRAVLAINTAGVGDWRRLRKALWELLSEQKHFLYINFNVKRGT